MSDSSACTICDAPLEPGTAQRLRHLRAHHPVTYRSLVFRLVVPWIFLGVVLAYFASSLPFWVPIVALVAAMTVSFSLRRRAAIEAGGAIRPSPAQLLRTGGYGAIAIFVLLTVVAVLTRG